MSGIRKRLEKIKATKRSRHETTVQFKIPSELRDQVMIQLKRDGLTFKDLVMAAIEEYQASKAK